MTDGLIPLAALSEFYDGFSSHRFGERSAPFYLAVPLSRICRESPMKRTARFPSARPAASLKTSLLLLTTEVNLSFALGLPASVLLRLRIEA
jgi:hypothetical protein